MAGRFVLALLLLASIVVATPSSAQSGGAAAATRTIAETTSVDYRATLVARKLSAGSGAPTASVTLTVSQKAGNGWRAVVVRRAAGTFFWNTVTGPHAVCRFELATARVGSTAPHLTLQLLVTPALGCEKAQTERLSG